MTSLQNYLKQAVQGQRDRHLYRQRTIIDGPQDVRFMVAGREMLSFCSNDYLGLANNDAVKQAFIKAVDRYGVGSGASHLVTGHSRAHHQLEQDLAQFTGREAVLLYSTGYMANLGVIAALASERDDVICDRLSHASLLDATRLSGARLRRYLHNDMASLQNRLQQCSTLGKKLIVTDGVFSMDGDLAELPTLADIAAAQQAWLVVDDAHGFGVLGAGGGGCVEHFGLNSDQVPILVGTLGKAFGVFGAFVAGSRDLVDYLLQFSRSYTYTTAIPPAVAAAVSKSLQLVQQETWRREKLMALINRFRHGAAQLGLPLMSSQTAIQPLLVGDPERVMSLYRHLQTTNIMVSAIRAPTVPKGSERLRITFSASHEEADIDRLLESLQKAMLAIAP